MTSPPATARTQLPKLDGDNGIVTIAAAYCGSRGKIARSIWVRDVLQIVSPAIEPGARASTRSQREMRALSNDGYVPWRELSSSGLASSAVIPNSLISNAHLMQATSRAIADTLANGSFDGSYVFFQFVQRTTVLEE